MRKILIAGQRINGLSKIGITLLTFFGLNWSQIYYITGLLGINSNIVIQNIPISLLSFLNTFLKRNFVISKILKKEIALKLRFEKKLGSYRGLRLRIGLPNRGQRTHSNARTTKKVRYG